MRSALFLAALSTLATARTHRLKSFWTTLRTQRRTSWTLWQGSAPFSSTWRRRCRPIWTPSCSPSRTTSTRTQARPRTTRPARRPRATAPPSTRSPRRTWPRSWRPSTMATLTRAFNGDPGIVPLAASTTTLRKYKMQRLPMTLLLGVFSCLLRLCCPDSHGSSLIRPRTTYKSKKSSAMPLLTSRFKILSSSASQMLLKSPCSSIDQRFGVLYQKIRWF